MQAYDSIVELCLLRAKKDDPKQLAIAAYRNGIAEGNKDMAEASNRRENSYAIFRRLLEEVDGKPDAVSYKNKFLRGHQKFSPCGLGIQKNH